MNYTLVQAYIVVTHAMSYDVLIGGIILYPIGVTIDYERKPHTIN